MYLIGNGQHIMEEASIEFEPNYPNNYGIFVSGYHVGYLEVYTDSHSNPIRYDFDDVLNGHSFVIRGDNREFVQSLIAEYYQNIIPCKHHVVARLDTVQLIEQIEHHQIPFSQVVLPRMVDSYQFSTSILFFHTEDAASSVRLLS